ncbi:ADP-ribosylation factor GTPase-activating protein AGD12 [Dichanthelium oligosanthes]|uniref:ADP-ribosylation factor GTPase-activating protein AGD12 n=1 Tax=Dichanthelium oligosanthes TaxID=888268 RepID=A0A1E5UPC1_9POAL|nr:ADP-ribosylation factor GTPase-activating protein AGD12 [Dichanthelium oligosanthes]
MRCRRRRSAGGGLWAVAAARNGMPGRFVSHGVGIEGAQGLFGNRIAWKVELELELGIIRTWHGLSDICGVVGQSFAAAAPAKMSSRDGANSGRASDKMRKLRELLHKSDNRICADCSAPDPKWASANIGVFICLKCSGVHRSLGTHVSKVLSVTLDQWTDDEINSMIEVGGNSYANAIYEAFLPEGYHKPHPDSSQEERADFIRSKYELQEFLKPSLRIVSIKSSFEAKTSVIKRNLNPVWNEELKLSVPHKYGPVKLQVFDHDLLSRDDIMGEAEIDLQPMISSAMAFGDPELLADMQIGKWLKSPDNALARDSAVNVVGGKVKQEVSLKLQNVESGEVDLELEWIPLTQ